MRGMCAMVPKMQRFFLILILLFLSYIFPTPVWSKDYLYVSNTEANLISVIDGDEGIVVREVPVGVEPCHIVVDHKGELIAVSHEEKRGEIWFLDRKTLRVENKVLLIEAKEGVTKTNCFFLAFSIDSRKLYAVNQFSGLLYVVDPVAGKVEKEIRLGKTKQMIGGIILSPDGRFLYISDVKNSRIFVLDTAGDVIYDHIVIDGAPWAIAVSPDGKFLYVADAGDLTLIIMDIETRKVTKRIPIGIQPTDAAISRDGRFVFVSSMISYDITVIDTELKEAVANIPVGAYPVGIVVSPDGKRVYVCNYNENTVSIIDAESSRETVRVPTNSTPTKIAIYHSL